MLTDSLSFLVCHPALKKLILRKQMELPDEKEVAMLDGKTRIPPVDVASPGGTAASIDRMPMLP